MALSCGQGCGRERECHIRWRGARRWRWQPQEGDKRLGFIARLRFDCGQALPEVRHLHQYVAQEDAAYGGGGGRGLRCVLQLSQLLLHARRPRGGRLCGDATDRRAKSRCVSALGRDTSQFDERREVVGLRGENLLNQLLKFGIAVRPSLPFHFDGQQVQRAQIARVQIDGSVQIGDCFGRIAARAFEHAQVGVNLAVPGSQRVRAIQALLCRIEIALTQRENAPVRPSRGFSRSQLRGSRQLAFGTHIVAHLHRAKTNVERLHELRVLCRLWLRQTRMATGGENRRKRDKAGERAGNFRTPGADGNRLWRDGSRVGSTGVAIRLQGLVQVTGLVTRMSSTQRWSRVRRWIDRGRFLQNAGQAAQEFQL